jgi:RimJ/RimL family protein N-acetyltransferase
MRNAFRAGERVYLRPVELEDMELFLAWMNDPEIHQYLARFKPLNRCEEKEWLEKLHTRPGECVFGIALKEGDRLIGTCGLRQAELPHRAADLGIAIGEPAFHGKGYGAEAMRLLLAYGFDTLGLHRIGLFVYANNARGIRCYEKCGFRREGVKREARWWNGRWWDVLEYGILEHEWRHATPPGAAK